MDTLSHAGWGYASIRGRGLRAARLGAVTGMAPDLLYFIPFKMRALWEQGWAGLSVPRDRGVWRADGPPMPLDLVQAYHDYYVWTHSLVVVAAAAAVVALVGKREWLWFFVPYLLHILMDIPTHERYLTPIFHPLSDWTFTGLAWSDPRVLLPNWIALAGVLVWLRWKGGDRG